VGDGLQERRHGGNRTAEPHFRRRHTREITIARSNPRSSQRYQSVGR
jgi:hypothetical protein